MKNNSFTEYFSKIINLINRVDSRIFIFVLLCLNLLSFHLYSNEEAYFPLAKQYIDPDWIPNSFTFSEWVGTRFLFQNIVGQALKYFSFETVAFWGRFLNFLAFSFPLALIFKKFKISNIGIFLLLQLFILNTGMQAFFGQEWIFRAFESKTIAYVFIFYSLYYLFSEKYIKVAVFAAIATYFHILVGGWFFCFCGIYMLFSKLNFIQLLKSVVTYVIMVSPFILYLTSHIESDGSLINGVNIDWVYVYFRNTHHTAPLMWKKFTSDVLPRILASVGLFGLCVFYVRNFNDGLIRKLNKAVVIILIMLFTALIVNLLDKEGHILKFYLFRIASIGTFCTYILSFLVFRSICKDWRYYYRVKQFVFIAICMLFIIRVGRTVNHFMKPAVNSELVELTSYVKHNTDLTDVVLWLDKDEQSFSRRARRESWVVRKFDPGGGKKIYEWYIRVHKRDEVIKDFSKLPKLLSDYKIDYVVTKKRVRSDVLIEKYHNDLYYLYMISNK